MPIPRQLRDLRPERRYLCLEPARFLEACDRSASHSFVRSLSPPGFLLLLPELPPVISPGPVFGEPTTSTRLISWLAPLVVLVRLRPALGSGVGVRPFTLRGRRQLRPRAGTGRLCRSSVSKCGCEGRRRQARTLLELNAPNLRRDVSIPVPGLSSAEEADPFQFLNRRVEALFQMGHVLRRAHACVATGKLG